jgi:DNA-directed RNA polymerase subunit E'/Rpb7
MLIKKHIEIAMNIQDCIGLYTDIDNNLKNMIIDRYQGRCLRQCFIVSIGDIIKYSDCVINQEGPPDFGIINVIFEAMAIVYTPNEIINGCIVVSRENPKTINCSAPHTDIVLSHNVLLDSAQLNQLVSVRVHKAKYTIGSDKISISAVPLIPSKTPIVYKYTPGPLPDDFADYVSNIVKNINQIIADSESIAGSKSYEFFKLILHAYKDQPAVKATNYSNVLDLVTKPPAVECYIARDPRLFPTDPRIYSASDISSLDRDDIRVVNDLQPAHIISIMLDEYCNNIRTVFELVKTYNTQTLLESHKNIWMVYGSLKNKQ